MTFEEKVDRLDGIFAYDNGCASSGIRDDGFKNELIRDRKELETLLKALAKQYLTSDQGYTFEDIAALVQWAEDEFDLVY